MLADVSEARRDLEQRLLTAAVVADSTELMHLYQRAAALADADGNADEAGFFSTHAYVWALVAGHPAAATIADCLRDASRLEAETASP